MQVTREDQAGDRLPERLGSWVVALERRPEIRVVVGFLVDDKKQGERIEQEVPAAARRVENLHLPWVFLRAVWDVDRQFEQFFLRRIISTFGGILGRLFPFLQKNLVGATDHESALVLELGVPLPHLVPDATQRVVCQELDHVPGREKLVAEGQLIRVAGGLALLASLVPQFLGREVLVDPADRLVLGPDPFQFLAVEQVDHLVQHPLWRVDPVRRVGGAEQHADLLRERAAQPVQEVSVCLLLMPGVVTLLLIRVLGEVEEEPLRLEPPADCFPKPLPAHVNVTHLHHLVGAEAVQVREGDLPDQLLNRLPRLVAQGPDVIKMGKNVLAGLPLSSERCPSGNSFSARTSSFLPVT